MEMDSLSFSQVPCALQSDADSGDQRYLYRETLLRNESTAICKWDKVAAALEYGVAK